MNEKELVITLAEAEQETVDAINGIMQKHGLPCYLFEPIVDKLHRQLIEGKSTELSQARARAAQLHQSGQQNDSSAGKGEKA